MLKKVVISAVLLLMAIASFGSLCAQGEQDTRYGGTLIIAKVFEPVTMDSLRTNYGSAIHTLITEPPLMRGPKGKYYLAGYIESCEVSEDGLTWTFKIKKGIKFQDGVPLDAEAFKWYFDMRRKPEYDILKYARRIKDIEVVDPYTVAFHLSQPDPVLRFAFTCPGLFGGLTTPHAVERYGEDYGHAMAYGVGPFVMTEWVKGDHMTFVRYEDYNWGPPFAENKGPAYLDKIIFKFMPEASSRLFALETGEVDAVYDVPYSKVDEIKRIPHVNVLTVPSNALRFIAMNITRPPFDDIRVRKALTLAINREELVKGIFFGHAEPAYTLNYATSQDRPTTKRVPGYDKKKAEELLDEAGWIDSNGDGIRDKDGKDLEFKLWTRTQTDFRRLALAVAAQWSEIGVQANVVVFDTPTLYAKINEGTQDATVWEHLWGMPDNPEWMFLPDGIPYPNQTHFQSAEYTKLFEKRQNAKTWAEAVDTWEEMNNYMVDQYVVIPLVHPAYIMAIKDYVKGVQLREGYWTYMPYFYDVYLTEESPRKGK